MVENKKTSDYGNRKELSRIPRSLSDLKNENLFSDSTIGGAIMMDILIYCANHKMKDLFGNIRFSVKDFCKRMGYNKANLQRKLSPEQLREIFGKEPPEYCVTISGHREYVHQIESIFEAMLYKLTKENLVLPVSQPNGTTRYTGINIVTYFEIADNFETKKRTKRMYTVSLSKEIQDLLYSNYNLIEINDYANVPDRKGYKRFYLILARMIFIIRYNIQKEKEASYSISIDQLALCFDIKETEPKKKKSKVIDYLKRINKYLQNTRFKYTAVKGEGQKFAYTIKFEFEEDVLSYFDEKYKAVFTSRFYTELQNLYIKINLPETGVHQYHVIIKEIVADPIENKKMINWIFSDKMINEKKALHDKAFYQTYGKTPEEMDVKVDFKNEIINFIQ